MARLALFIKAMLLFGFSMPAHGFDGTISFVGHVVNETCTVVGSSHLEVELPDLSDTALNDSGETAGRTPFVIDITGCPDMPGFVSTYFEPDTDVDATDHLLLNANGSAENVGVQIRDAALHILDVGPDHVGIPARIEHGHSSMRYSAEFKATGAVEAGSVRTSVRYTLVYL